MAYIDATETPDRATHAVKLHGEAGFAGMRKAGQLSAACLDMLVPHVKPGVTTAEIDRLVREFGVAHGAIPATIFYRGYAKSVCTSINHVVCHGIPNDKPLKDGDIVNIDVTLLVDGWHGDTSRMYLVGDVGVKARRLVDVTYESLMLGIAAAKPGDVLIFNGGGHAGIYAGNGMMWDSPRTGSVVSKRPVFGGVSGYGRP